MPFYCSAFGCKNRDGKETRAKGISFHAFPSDQQQSDRWAVRLCRQDEATGSLWKPGNRAVVCSEHFLPSDFFWQWGRKLIKPDAEPTVFSFTEAVKKQKASADRSLPTNNAIMPNHCTARGCKNQDYPQVRSKGITFHRFPKDKVLREQWTRAVNRIKSDGQPWQPSPSSTLCSQHFRPEMFDRTGQTVYLMKNAVPTEFDCFPSKFSNQKGWKNIGNSVVMKKTSENSFPKQNVLESPKVTEECEGNVSYSCAALNCSDVTWLLFRFPKDKDRCMAWVRNCRRRDLKGKDPAFLHANYQLCGRHFDDSQFLNGCRSNLLISDAVPTIFAPSAADRGSKRLRIDSASTITNKIRKVIPSFEVSEESDVQISTEASAIDNLSQSGLSSIASIIQSASQLGMRAPMLEFFEERLKKCCRENRHKLMPPTDSRDLVSSRPSQGNAPDPEARVVIQQCRSAKLLLRPATKTTPDLSVQIGCGIIVFVCFLKAATSETVKKLAKAVLDIRLSKTGDGKRVSILDLPGDILVVPQTTLGGTVNGAVMQYHKNADKEAAELLYNDFVSALQSVYDVNSATVEHGCSVLKGAYGNEQVLTVEANALLTHVIDI